MAASSRRRTVARSRARVVAKDLRDRERLALLEAGGTPAHPIDVVSASLVEPRARSLPCLACGAAVRLIDHDAKTIDGVLLRVTRTECPMCEQSRTSYFAIRPPLVN
jgi:hypothetical protein